MSSPIHFSESCYNRGGPFVSVLLISGITMEEVVVNTISGVVPNFEFPNYKSLNK